jgi:hypothetical protein
VEQLTLPASLTTGLLHAARPASSVVAVRPVIGQLRAAGLGWSNIARQLNTNGISTPTGRGRWYPETVMRTLDPERHAAYMRDYRARRRLLTG